MKPAMTALGIGLLLPAIALAQGKIDEKLMRQFGGVFSTDCPNYQTATFIKYLGDSLVVQVAGKEVLVGRKLRTVPTYLGASPPADFQSAVSSQVQGADEMVFVLFRNPSGAYVSVEGGPKVMAALPPGLKGAKVRHCDPNRNAMPGAPVVAEPNPPDMLKDAGFKALYLKALGPLAREPWLARMDGPAPPVRRVQVGGVDYQLISVCKTHDCHDNNSVLLYSKAQSVLYGKVLQQATHSTLIGNPPPAIAAELERLWKTEWRAGK